MVVLAATTLEPVSTDGVLLLLRLVFTWWTVVCTEPVLPVDPESPVIAGRLPCFFTYGAEAIVSR